MPKPALIKPGLQFFLDKFSMELRSSVAAFNAARLFLPRKVVELKPDVHVAAVDSLQAFPFLNKASILINLKSENLTKTVDIDAELDPISCCRVCFLRAEGNVRTATGCHTNDYIQTSLMLQYNNR